ncbi:MAG TPA: cysteine hydrolase [Alphaproteobacteria bacterium]|nr:cysteine hydrolase [Alphaproteobacteria bacterium]
MTGDEAMTAPFETVRWDLNPGRTVLVVIDPQNDFLHADGWYAQQGIDIAHMQRIIEPTRQLLEDVQAKNIPVVWTRHGSRSAEDAGPFMQLRPFLKEGGLRQDSWGYEIYEELGPRAADWYVEKSRLSAFYNTNLEGVLRTLNADTVLFAGVLTNQCVAASSKDAMYRDFRPIVIEDCTGTTMPHLHEPAIEMMRVGWCDVRDLESTLSEIRQLAATP